LAQELIEEQHPSIYNQAIMEFGALQCKPKSPDCATCPLQLNCFAFKNKLVNTLPVKLKAAEKKVRYLNYFLCTEGDRVLVSKRTESDIWQHLYDFPSIETSCEIEFNNSQFLDIVAEQFGKMVKISALAAFKHLLTHQIIYIQFFALDNYIVNFNKNAGYEWVTWAQFEALPQPKVISNFLTGYLTKY
jgi:A/G-specific adenine glycosylase